MDRELIVNNLNKIIKELRIARNELHNLRQQMRALKCSQERNIEDIQNKLSNWKCQNCKVLEDVQTSDVVTSEDGARSINQSIILEPIGYISTEFSLKKGLPRQPSLCPQLLGKITISKSVFTNPEHALEGLRDYSHMWILFHFHRNESKHALAKVSPPRLNGDKTGVFATRSPHRPCPIGLSLVRIDCIQGSTIYFSGVDMLDKTPVLDIKPYIPQYDDPTEVEFEQPDETLEVKTTPVPPGSPGIFPGNREEPDGEESDDDQQIASFVHPLPQSVRVPSWVMSSSPKSITLTSEAEEQLTNLGKADLKPVIQRILNEDPRSNYLKQKIKRATRLSRDTEHSQEDTGTH